jgi:hypothetical protein
LESPAHRPAALDALRRDYGRLTGSRDDVGWLRLYLETLRNSAFGAVLVFRVLSSVVGSRVRFHGLRLLMNLLVPRRRDIEISPLAVIGEGLVIFHGSGLVIGSGVKAGKNLSLEHGVTLVAGARRRLLRRVWRRRAGPGAAGQQRQGRRERRRAVRRPRRLHGGGSTRTGREPNGRLSCLRNLTRRGRSPSTQPLRSGSRSGASQKWPQRMFPRCRNTRRWIATCHRASSL